MSVLVALTLVTYLCWLMVEPFMSVIVWAVVMVVLFYPLHRRLEQRLHRPSLTAGISTLLVIVAILLPTLAVATATVAEMRDMTARLPTSIAGALDPARPTTGPAVRFVERFISLDRYRDPAFVNHSIEGWSGGMAIGSLRLVGGALSVMVQMAITTFTIFFLFKDARLARTSLYDLVPIENRRLRDLFVRTRDVITASVYGTLLLSLIQGALGGLAFLVLGLPSPFLWGVVMSLASILPMLGSFVVWVPAAIYLFANGQTWQAVALTAWGAIIIGLADNVLRPVLVGQRTGMHELLVFFAVLGGLKVFGAVGLVVGPVIFAVALGLIQALKEVGVPPVLQDELPAEARPDPGAT